MRALQGSTLEGGQPCAPPQRLRLLPRWASGARVREGSTGFSMMAWNPLLACCCYKGLATQHAPGMLTQHLLLQIWARQNASTCLTYFVPPFALRGARQFQGQAWVGPFPPASRLTAADFPSRGCMLGACACARCLLCKQVGLTLSARCCPAAPPWHQRALYMHMTFSTGPIAQVDFASASTMLDGGGI